MKISVADAAIVVPTFNESDNVPSLVERVFGLYPAAHLLIVDDHSPDGTAGIVRSLQPRYPNLMLLERMNDPSFGRSYRDGFRRVLAESWCRAVVTMDADFSHDPAVICEMVERLSESDVVIGSRYIPNGGVANWSLHRRLLSRSANLYVRAILWMPVRDTTAGFMCMRREVLERIPLERIASEGYAFLVELKYLLSVGGARIAEHPITFSERREGQSKMSGKKIWESVRIPWRIRFGAVGVEPAPKAGAKAVSAD